MDELLRGSRRGHRVAPDQKSSWLTVSKALGRKMVDRLQAIRHGRPLMDPLPFLAIATVVGITSVMLSVYSPAYVVTVDGTDLGLVKSKAVFQNVVDRVERKVSAIVGYDYTLENEITYDFALVKRDEFTPVAEFEAPLFSRVDDVFQGYSLTVDGQFIGAATRVDTLQSILNRIKSPYVGEDTLTADFVENVAITKGFFATDVEQDVETITAALTANTAGQTVYEVEKGDTFMAIAQRNNMSMAELQELNPDVNINRLHIGQLLTIKEEIPFLSVRTTKSISYEEPIPCPITEIPDDSMYQGETRVIDAGIPGTALVSADLVYVNGKEVERNITSEITLTEPTMKYVAAGTKERPSWYPNGYFIWPCSGRITSNFGWRYIFGSSSYHGGIDIAVPYGTNIKAADGGKVTFSGYKGTYGYLVIVDHMNGKQSYYGHNSKLLVKAGDKVYQGQTIAKAGSTGRSTGNHCHFEVKINGTSVNPRHYLP